MTVFWKSVGGGRVTSRWCGKRFVEFKDYFFDKVRDVAVSWSSNGNGPLMGMCFVDVCRRVFDVS